MKHLVERFLRYVTFDTQSNPHVAQCPSSPGQLVFAELLKQEMLDLGLSDVTLDEHGYLMAKLRRMLITMFHQSALSPTWILHQMRLVRM